MALFDTMKYIGSDVGTVGFGGCMGMSGFLLAVGKKVRASQRRARNVCHMLGISSRCAISPVGQLCWHA